MKHQGWRCVSVVDHLLRVNTAIGLIPCTTHQNQLNPHNDVPIVFLKLWCICRGKVSIQNKSSTSSRGSCHCIRLWAPTLIQYVVWVSWDLRDGEQQWPRHGLHLRSICLQSMEGMSAPGSRVGTWKEVPTNHRIRLPKNTNFLLDPERKG